MKSSGLLERLSLCGNLILDMVIIPKNDIGGWIILVSKK